MRQRCIRLAAAGLLLGLTVGNPNDLRGQSVDAVASPEIHLLVKQALEDRLSEARLPGGELLASARVGVRVEMPLAGLRLGPEALPTHAGYEFYLVSAATAQVEADKTGERVHLIFVDRPSISGDSARVSLGVDIVWPREPQQIKLCCCIGEAEFRRTNGRWIFVQWANMVCS